ncbi:IS5/IS1182 family transposase, partial [Priestia koreensis]|nr:IS5/IS1182 family transposase [Priestia koreensis]
FTRMSVRGKENVKKELGFAFMAVNVRKYIASSKKRSWTHPTNQQKGFTSSYSDDVNPFFVIFG